MPRRRNREKDQNAGKRMPPPQVSQVPTKQQEDKNNPQREHYADEPLGEHIERATSSEAPRSRPRRPRLVKGDPEQQHSERKPQAHDHVGKEDMAVNENPKRSNQDQRRIEPSDRRIEEARTAEVNRHEKSKRIDRQRQPRRPILGAKNTKAGSHAPIQQRSLLQVADAVRVERNPVMPRDHFPRHLSMHRIRIIQQRRTQKREAPIKQHPQSANGEEDSPGALREISCNAGSPKQLTCLGQLKRGMNRNLASFFQSEALMLCIRAWL